MGASEPWETLRGAAQEAARSSYAPYSKLSVGAAVRTQSGHVYGGANIENASYGLSMCAERVAIAEAVRQEPAHDRDGLIVAVVATDGNGTVLSPCGACRQVILEFGPHAQLWLPTGRISIQVALSGPFVPPQSILAAPDAAERRLDRHIINLLELDDNDKVLVMSQLSSLRRTATQLYPNEITLDSTRSMLFVNVDRSLVIAPGFFSNLEDPLERTIRIPPRYGLVGSAYARGEPNFGVPCRPGALPGDVLPPSEQLKVSDKLNWVVAWPLKSFGAVSLDGYDELTDQRMRDLSESSQLRRHIDLLANLTDGM